jgi:hypothetical protein
LPPFDFANSPTDKHLGPDGLSRREPIDDKGDPEEWVDNILTLVIWLDTWKEHHSNRPSGTAKVFQATERVGAPHGEPTFLSPSENAHTYDNELPEIFKFLASG